MDTDRIIYNQEKEKVTYLNRTIVNKIEICQADLNRLDTKDDDSACLSGEIINAYLLEITSSRDIAMPSTYFGKKISEAHITGYEGIMRKKRIEHWLTKTSKAIIPLHQPNHWTLCVVERKTETIYHYNSLIRCTSDQQEMLEGIGKYLTYIGYLKNPTIVQLKNIPQQKNGVDCGVYTCAFGYYAALDKEIDFDQRQMHYWRMTIIKELMKSKIPRVYNKTTFQWAYAEGGVETFITYDNISKETIKDDLFEDEEVHIPEPDDYKNYPQQNVENICKFLENMTIEDKKQRLINNYREEHKDMLAQLRNQTHQPYLDYNKEGSLITINMNKDLSRSLRLKEVIQIIRQQHNLTISEAWKVLEKQLKRNPQILQNWLNNAWNQCERNPTKFRFGSNGNMKKLLTIMKKIRSNRKNHFFQSNKQTKRNRRNPYHRRRDNRLKTLKQTNGE